MSSSPLQSETKATIRRRGSGVGLGVELGVELGVCAAVGVGVGVCAAVGGRAVDVGTGVGRSVAVAVALGVGVAVWVAGMAVVLAVGIGSSTPEQATSHIQIVTVKIDTKRLTATLHVCAILTVPIVYYGRIVGAIADLPIDTPQSR